LASKQRGSEKGGNGNGNRKLAEVAPPGLRLAENGMIVLADFRYD
jgi:arabinogalactan endo-1,4-beta-galactosidase